MRQFIQKHCAVTTSVLSGFDRIVFRGLLRGLMFVDGMKRHLSRKDVPRREFGRHVEKTTKLLVTASLAEAQRLERPVVYLPSSKTRKESVAKEVLAKSPVDAGLLCVLKCVEPCHTFEMYRNRETKQLELVQRPRKCLFLYHYYMDPAFGLMNARIQTWYPFPIQICINGRQWLARRMHEEGLDHTPCENAFSALANPIHSQRLFDELPRLNWAESLGEIAARLNPIHAEILGPGHRYYWTVHQSEWATDVLFTTPRALQRIYPQLVWGAITTFSTRGIMRFLGKQLQSHFAGQAVSHYHERPEGLCVKHDVNGNSVKMYDKAGRILRVETTITNSYDIPVFRPKEGGASDDIQQRPMRRGIADIQRRAQLSQRANERYLDALSQLDTETPLAQIISPVAKRITRNGAAYRGLRPWAGQDLELLRAINRPEYIISGFRNRDLVAQLYPRDLSTPRRTRAASARISYRLRILHAHGLIAKLPGSRRYRITRKGRQLATTILMAQHATLKQLNPKAA